MLTFYQILEDMDGRMVSVNGRHAVKLSEIRPGTCRAYRMPGCSLGDYFMVLSWPLDKDIVVK